jgi:hypothetical protein
LVVKAEWIRLQNFPKLDICCCTPLNPTDSWVLPSDGCLSTSTEDDEEGFTSSSSPSFPSSPNEHNITAKTISTENEIQVLTDFLSISSIQSSLSDKRKRTKRKSTSKDVEMDEDEEMNEGYDDHTLTRRSRRSRRCTTASVVAGIDIPTSTPILPRTCKSFSGVSTATFNPKTRLPLNSSPSPLKRTPMSLASKLRAKFTSNDTDSSSSDSEYVGVKNSTIYGSSQSNNALLCNFEESALNGRLEPISSIDGFKLQLAVSGSFFVPHTIIPVTTYFFDVSDDNAPSLYLGHCSFKDSPFGRKAIHIPKKCIVQATLFNPHGSVVRIFIVRIDVHDIPPRSKTFIRQRTCATAVNDDKISLSSISSTSSQISSNLKLSILRYLINLRLATDRSGKLYLHTDIRLLFSNNHTDIDIMNLNASEQQQQNSNKRGTLNSSSSGKSHNNIGGDNINDSASTSPITYELITTTKMPQKPKYSPIK